MNNQSLIEILSKNRAEELGYDVWEHFVIPPFYDRLDLQTAKKPRVILGGRGCGKTMLLRYLSHQSVFSQNRRTIPRDAVSRIGLYWRTDTQFGNAMTGRGIPDDTWQAAFNHYAAIILGIEIIRSLKSVAASTFECLTQDRLDKLDFERMKVFDSKLPARLSEFHQALENRVWEFETWINDVRKVEQPRLLPESFIKALISIVTDQIPCLKTTVFSVYIDEYENLCNYQQKIVNTWLKHSEPPLIYNLAMKRHSFKTMETLGSESFYNVHDFRQYDLDSFTGEAEFEVFAAEILFLILSNAKRLNIEFDIEKIKDPASLSSRKESSYMKNMVQQANEMFPGLSQTELADYIFKQQPLLNKLQNNIEIALKTRNSSISPSVFFRPSAKKAMIIIPALLHRKSLQPAEVQRELDALEANADNKFSGSTNWIHNNFFASVIQLFTPFSRTCPVYSGFEAFCIMSRGNIRHFLELCYESLSKTEHSSENAVLKVDPLEQAEASKQASTTFLREIRGFGQKGPQLLMFTYRLGNLFALAHARKTLSENEQNHFAIIKGRYQLTSSDEDFIKEALKWSILFENESTKDKSDYQVHGNEYMLNPIYAPYFGISYRRKRRLELSSDDIFCLIKGDLNEYTKLLKTYSSKWDIDLSDQSDLPLFQFLEKEARNASQNETVR